MGALLIIVVSNIFSANVNVLTLVASCVGVTSLIIAAKGNVWSQILMILFSILYGIISWQFHYWGEMLRSSYYAVGYAANDIILIVLWIMATIKDPSYFSVTIIFTIFFFFDLYGFVSWRKRETAVNVN